MKDYCRIMEIERNAADLKLKVNHEKREFKKGLKLIGEMLQKDDNHKEKDIMIALSKSFVCKAYGILGFPIFLDGHYLYIITSKELVGKVLGGKIWRVKEARLEMILNQEASCLYKVGKQRVRETKYLGIFNALDVTDFYFSYDIDLTHNIETSILEMCVMNGVQCHI